MTHSLDHLTPNAGKSYGDLGALTTYPTPEYLADQTLDSCGLDRDQVAQIRDAVETDTRALVVDILEGHHLMLGLEGELLGRVRDRDLVDLDAVADDLAASRLADRVAGIIDRHAATLD